jgi:outer membrane protein assembly factor BamB
LYWGLYFVVGSLTKPYFVGFLYGLASAALLALAFLLWAFFNRGMRRGDRLGAILMVIAAGLLAVPFWHPSIGLFGLLMNLPIVLTTLTAWLLLARWFAISWKRVGAVAVVALTWGYFTLIRIDGLNSDLQADVRWRWIPSAEDLFLAEAPKPSNPNLAALTSANVLRATPKDWPDFRGRKRDGVIHGIRIATDWDTQPPRQLWKHRVGPAWSSLIVVGDRLFTQEQRGEKEAVVAYDAGTGQQVWVHEDAARFWETVSGAGPRATPSFAGGRLYTMGGTGILNCLDAATGKAQWSQDITRVTEAKVPLWGFSSSPLVVDDAVIVFAGGEGDKSLLAYWCESGKLAWTAPAGPGSYSSPHLATLAGKQQCLMLSDGGLTAVDPQTGTVLWKDGVSWPGAPRTVQPHVVGANQLLVGTLTGSGVTLLEVIPENTGWKTDQRWTSQHLKPEFPDFVVHEGNVYGFDTAIFCCINATTGKRCWKEGRYGRGQVMLLADQSLLLVTSETGEAILLAANPKRHEELGRFQAVNGKTWNHPVIAHGRLYVRNAEEMACYELRGQ